MTTDIIQNLFLSNSNNSITKSFLFHKAGGQKARAWQNVGSQKLRRELYHDGSDYLF